MDGWMDVCMYVLDVHVIVTCFLYEEKNHPTVDEGK